MMVSPTATTRRGSVSPRDFAGVFIIRLAYTNKSACNALWMSGDVLCSPSDRHVENHRRPKRFIVAAFVPNAELNKQALVQAPLQLQQLCERFRIGYRRFAGEIFTDVGRGFAVDGRHGRNRLVLFGKEFLAFATIGQNENFLWQKMSTHFRQQGFCRIIIDLSGNNDLAWLA